MFIFETSTIYTVVTLLVGYYTYKWIIYPLYLTPLSKIPGPPPDHFLIGNFVKIVKTGNGAEISDWAEKYGNIFKYYGLLNTPILSILDGDALQRILNTEVYNGPFCKPKGFLGIFEPIIGNSLLGVEDDIHKKQRRLMTPGFSHASLKHMVPVIVKYSNVMIDMWKIQIKKNKSVDNKSAVKIDAAVYLSKLTLDVIGKIGFDYEFDTLRSSSKTTLGDELKNILATDMPYALAIRLIAESFPILGKLPLKINEDLRKTSLEIEKITTKLVQNKYDELKKGELNSTDLVSILVKANPVENMDKTDQMSFDEIRNQIMTFLIAGHETTGVVLSWTLYFLAKDQKIQNRLREEIVKEFPDKDFVVTFEQINSLEYLNAVCKETLRHTPPVPVTTRATREDTTINGYFVPKDTLLAIPIYTIHHMKSIWGEDAEEYNPSRWLTEKTENISNYQYLPFLSGPRSCIGSKVALAEFKIVLAMLLRNFQFNEIEGFKVTRSNNISLRPDPTVMLLVSEIDY